MFGSDSAPHPRSKKECSGCAAGVFTAPIALEVLCELFESHGRLENLQAFVSDNAKAIYNISPPKKEVILAKKAKKIAKSYDIVVPFWADREISWSIEEINND
jgi:dihydroorotase